MKKFKKKVTKKIDETVNNTKKALNINKYNKWLFIFETFLFVGVLDEFIENLILSINLNILFHVILIMLSVGILFTAAFSIIEPLTKKILAWLVRINSNKIVRILMHIIILSVLYYLYAFVFFGAKLQLTFNVAINAT
ncbi:hypothetical protein HN789_02985 [archaeon]|jgi:hypothetical protein|nr:hypothetical protein [archaeon]MBT4023231.1 hypothetical protein [archaeon]MBT4271901.1 hypothetical protein [archaeon]MBT4461000.1 hypothetical protein [archaeon]MBT4858424.1 hypothetical protein [archaeon]